MSLRAADINLNRVSSIDGLRGAAALAVLLYHSRGVFFVGIHETYRMHGIRPNFDAWFEYLTAPIGLGWLGVTLFFVLSGYCIHRRGARELAAGNRINFKAFAKRRFWRIYPTYVAALLITALVDHYLAARSGKAAVAQDDSPFAFIVSLLSLQGYLAPYFGSNGVFWTLAMEIHLYLAYPFLFCLSRKIGPQKTLIFTLVIGLTYVGLETIFHLDEYLPYRFERGPVFLPYWFTWTTGFYVAEMEANRAAEPSAALLRIVMAGGFLSGCGLVLLGIHVLADMCFALFFACAVYLSLKPTGIIMWNGTIARVLSTVGVFSYSLYATHAPMLYIFKSFLRHSQERSISPLTTYEGAAFAMFGAWLFFLIVERWSIARPRIVAALRSPI